MLAGMAVVVVVAWNEKKRGVETGLGRAVSHLEAALINGRYRGWPAQKPKRGGTAESFEVSIRLAYRKG